MTHTKRIAQAAAAVLLTVAVPTVFNLIRHHGAHDNPHSLVFQQSAGETWKTQASNYHASVQAHGISIPVGHREFQLKIQNAKHSSGIGVQPDQRAEVFQQVLFPEVLPGIDVVYHGSPAHSNAGHAVEFDFRIAAGADPGNIHMDLGPANAVTLEENGVLSVYSAEAEVQMQPPVAWQENHGRRTYIDARYRLDGQVAGFELGAYDLGLPILIDPTILVRVPLQPIQQMSLTDPAVTAGDGTAGRSARALAFGSDGSIYLAGRNRAWLSKLNPAGDTELFHSYAGAATRDAINALAVDAAGNAYVAGSVSADGAQAGFTAIFDPSGNRSAYTALPSPATALVLGPAGEVYYAAGSSVALQGGWQLTAPGPVRALAIDSNGILYAAGKQASTKDGGTPGYDSWVARVQVGESGAQWAWTMPLGGFGTLDEARALAIAPDGSLYVAGVTNSFNFPVQNAAQDSFAGTQDAFIAKIRTDGSGADWSTFYGGSGSTSASALALDAAGNLMLAGSTDSPNLMLAQQPGNTGENGFFARLDAAGNILESAYSPAPGAARLYSVASSPDGEAWVAGASSAGVEEVLAAKVSSNRGVAVPSRPGRSIKPLTAAGTAAQLGYFSLDPRLMGIKINGLGGVAGIPLQFQVQVEDASGNLVTGSSAAITVIAGPASKFTATAVSGIATFSITIDAAGSYTFFANATNISSTGLSVTIASGSPASLQFASGTPTSSIAGAPSQIMVQIEDAYGNVCTSSTASVVLDVVQPGSASISSSPVKPVNGVATFSIVAPPTLGLHSLIATTTFNGKEVKIDQKFSIVAGPPAHLSLTTQPANSFVGWTLPTFAVQVTNAYGVPLADNVTLTSAPANLMTTAATVNGIATFSNIVFSAAGNYTLTASVSDATLTATAKINIQSAQPTQVSFFAAPTSGKTGVPTAVVVYVLDANGNVVAGSNAPVTLTPIYGEISEAPLPTVNAINGVATFNVVFTTPSYLNQPSYNSFMASSPGLTSAVTNTFIVEVKPTKLVFTTQPPSTVTLNQPLKPSVVVQAQDDYGNFYKGNLGVKLTTALAPIVENGPFPTSDVVSGVRVATGGSGSDVVNGVEEATGGAVRFITAYLTGSSGTYVLIASNATMTSAISTKFVLQP